MIAPSRVIQESQIEKAVEVLKGWGLEIVFGKHLFAKDGYFAGSDDQREQDCQYMLNDAEIKGIFCARGGYGMTRIIDKLDLAPLLKYPKWIIGFSDITALHLALHQNNIESIHGLMPVQFDHIGVEESLTSLYELLFKGTVNYSISSHPMNRCGVAVAGVIGGNLSLIVESLGTATEISTDDKILFLEEIDEYLYKIDRMFMQLRRAGKLNKLAGLMVGDFLMVKDTQIAFGKSIFELIDDHFKGADFPVAYNFPVGHEPKNLAIPCGRKMRFVVAKDNVQLMEAASI